MLRETKTKSKKFRIRWSKVPRVLEPLKSSYGHFSHPAGQGHFKPKNTQNGNKSRFPGATCISANVARDKNEEKEIPHPMVKSTARFGALKSSYGHFSHPAGHGRGKFSSRKTPKMAINRDSRGYVHFQQMLRQTKTKSKKFRIRWSKVPRVLEPLKSSYGHFSHPAGHGHFKPKNTQNGNKSRFPGATCIFSKCCERPNRRARNSASDGQKYRAF